MRLKIAILYLCLLGLPFFQGIHWQKTQTWRLPSSLYSDCAMALQEILEHSQKGIPRRRLAHILDAFRRRHMANISPGDREWLIEKSIALKDEVIKRREYLDFLLQQSRLKTNQALELEIQQLKAAMTNDMPPSILEDGIRRMREPSNLTAEQKRWLSGKLREIFDKGRLQEVEKVNRQFPINSQYANSFYPLSRLPKELRDKYPHSVHFNAKGFPNFNAYVLRSVDIEVTGVGHVDFARANAAAEYKSTPKNYTWHHHQNGRTMQLIPTDLHDAVKHTGGVAVVTRHIKRIRGALPLGTEYAGRHLPESYFSPRLIRKYPNGVFYKKNGHPDLSPYSIATVEIESTGKKRVDMGLANAAANLDGVPPGHTWKLKEDGRTMELVPRELLQAIPHTELY